MGAVSLLSWPITSSCSTDPVLALYCVCVPLHVVSQVLINNVGWVSSDVKAFIWWYAAMLLDEQAVTCHVTLPPAGVQSFRQFQTHVMDLCACCLLPHLPRNNFIKWHQLDRQISEMTKTRRITTPWWDNETVRMGVGLYLLLRWKGIMIEGCLRTQWWGT
jgi:hypothetical protein